MANKLEAVHWFSWANTWIDFVVICTPDDKERVVELVDKAMDDWFDNPDIYGGYGDAVEYWLKDEEIPYKIICHDSEDESDEYEEFWNKILSQLF